MNKPSTAAEGRTSSDRISSVLSQASFELDTYDSAWDARTLDGVRSEMAMPERTGQPRTDDDVDEQPTIR
jgi:hypothetical protein